MAIAFQCASNGVCTPKNATTKTKFETLQKQVNRAAISLGLNLSVIPVDGVIGTRTLASIIKISEKLPDTTWLFSKFAIYEEAYPPTTKFVADNVDKVTALLAAVAPATVPSKPSTTLTPIYPLPGTQQSTQQSSTTIVSPPIIDPSKLDQIQRTNVEIAQEVFRAQKAMNWLIGIGIASGVILLGTLIAAKASSRSSRPSEKVRERRANLQKNAPKGRAFR